MTSRCHTLPGLDPQNPLGYLAALGLLRVVHERTAGTERPVPQLSFTGGGTVPQLQTNLSFDDLVDLVLADAAAQADNLVLNLSYGEKDVRDLKPPPDLARELLETCAMGPRSVADLAAAMFSELVQDNNGNTKPTGFHFTAGQQTFLKMAQELRTGITAEDLQEALVGPWLYRSKLPSMSWDSTATRYYALRAINPTKDKKTSVAAANWLGIRALAYFPVFVEMRYEPRLLTTCVRGGWKDSSLCWPVWDAWLTVPVVASLLRGDVRRLTRAERSALGVTQVFCSRITRSDQGGYGSFLPAEPVLPPLP